LLYNVLHQIVDIVKMIVKKLEVRVKTSGRAVGSDKEETVQGLQGDRFDDGKIAREKLVL
jgi:hypothetical protein